MVEFDLESKVEDNTLVISVALPEEKQQQYEYAYYLVKDGERILTKWYSGNNKEIFVLEGQGAYYVTCFVRNIEKKSDIKSKHTQLFIYPWESTDKYAIGLEQSLLERRFDIRSQIIDDVIECEVRPFNNDFQNLEFAFYLMNEFEKTEMTSYSPYNQVRFSLRIPGIYSVRCFVRRNQELVIKTSRFHGFEREESISPEENIHELFGGGQLQYLPFKAPYTDFCLVVTKDRISSSTLTDIRKRTNLFITEEKWHQSYIYKIGEEEVIQQDIILSGIINEGPQLIFGQKDIRMLEDLLTDGKNISTMIGKFFIYRKQDVITVTCDYFNANSAFYFWNNETAVVADRLNLVLTVIHAMGLKKEINEEYIGATMTFGDGMISGTNFMSELAVKNLYVLPVNRYIEISEYGLYVLKKSINYKKIPYNDIAYRELLDKAKNDILYKLKNIMNSPDVAHYKIGLSAGFDSRLNLAVLLCNPEVLKETKVVTWDVPSANDLDVSVQLTNYYGMSYARYEECRIRIKEYDVEHFVEYYRNFNEGMYHAVFNLPGFAMKSANENQTMSFIGAFGETMRSHYYMGTRNFVKSDDNIIQIVKKMANRLDIYRITHYGDYSFCKNLYNEVANIPGESDYEKFDNLFTFHYLRYHFNDLMNRLWLDGHYYSLFMSPYLFEASRMLTMEERCNNKIMLDMCYILYPEILSFPFSSYGSLDNDIIKEKWGNVIFNPESLPDVELNNDRSSYEAVAKENDKQRENLCIAEEELLLQLYDNVMNLYNILRQRRDIGKYFDEHLYYYIQCIKKDMKHLVYIFSKLCGIYDQIYGIEDCR